MVPPTLTDQDAFKKFIEPVYLREAIYHGSSIEIDWNRNAVIAFTRYRKLERQFSEALPNPEKGADHFKQAAALCFSLRRARIIGSVKPIDALKDAISKGDASELHVLLAQGDAKETINKFRVFVAFADEICAFQTGLRVVHFYEAQKKAAFVGGNLDNKQWESILFNTRPILSNKFNLDVIKILRDHSLSPHSLYLLFKACFDKSAKNRELPQ
jgi:hypothetical protein